MKILLVDDEALARARMRQLLAAHQEFQIVGEAENGHEALDAVAAQQPDVLLLDIRMPSMDGLEVAKVLAQRAAPPAVIFCTAYDEHALAAFDAHALDYLLKPVRRERLLEALARVRQRMEQNLAAPKPKARTQLNVRVRGEMKLVPIADVLYLLADAKYVEVHRKQDTLLIEESLVQLEEEFSERFVRIHRNCLVAKCAIVGLGKTIAGDVTISLRDAPEKLEVSRRNVAAVRKLMKQL
jgi:two-component system, LytTR family, response regulator AlgR